MQNYDIIGDIHGCSLTLVSLLKTLGYAQGSDGTYRHASCKAIFLGDFVDRGPFQREVISIVRAMIDSGAALSVMGNHEFNAIAYHTKHKGEYLRPHNEKNLKQHWVFLEAYEDDADAYADIIGWFKTLPLWLDLGDIKIIHACWDQAAIELISDYLHGHSLLTQGLLIEASRKGTWQYKAVETILKGKEVLMPAGTSFKDKDGNLRHEIRVRWWDQCVKTYREAFMGPEHARTHIPDDEIVADHLIEYSHDEPPVFLGHYWLEGEPEPLASNIACTDYSVAKPGGKLVAYRWDGERVLDKSKFVCVGRLEI